jgi:hypothetical protein
MPHDFWTDIINENSSETNNIEISSPAPFYLEIRTPHLISTELIGKLFYSIYNQAKYLFDYFDYQVKVGEENPKIDKKIIQEYFSLI